MTGDDEERKGKEVGLLKLGEPSREEYRADEAKHSIVNKEGCQQKKR